MRHIFLDGFPFKMEYAEKIIKADADSVLSEILGKIKSEALSEVLVYNSRVLQGVFSPKYITRSKMDIVKAKIGRFCKPATFVKNDESNETLIKAFLDSSHNIIVKGERNMVERQVHLFDVFERIEYGLQGIKIGDVRLKQVWYIYENDRIGKAIQMLHENPVNALVVLDEKNEGSGIITHFDIIRNIHLYSYQRDYGQKSNTQSKAFKAEFVKLVSLPALNFLKYKNPDEVSSNQKLSRAIELMVENETFNLLVKDKKSIITAKDILRCYNERVSR